MLDCNPYRFTVSDMGGEGIELRAAGTVPTRKASADSFRGTVWQDPIIEAPAPARIRASRVSFEPGARTAWHTHPLGQTLYVDGEERQARADAQRGISWASNRLNGIREPCGSMFLPPPS